MNCRPEDMLVYAVTDRAWLKGESLKDQVEKALKGGVTFVQLREKNLDRRLFLEEAAAIKELCDSFHVPCGPEGYGRKRGQKASGAGKDHRRVL